MIGSGAIGGKACGMLLARKIVEKELPEYVCQYEAHDSWYVGSDVFYTYIVANDCWDLRIAQRSQEGYFDAAGALKDGLLAGEFPSNIRDQFRKMLDYFGQNPIIVRSSSFLEDGFGNAFAGKYESVFCANRGTLEERLDAFEDAVRTVYASTMDASALQYRRQRGLDKVDEQMAVLVQRVSGSCYGSLYMPCAAGVGYSYSTYKWLKDMRPDAGMLRLVMGLGTKAVDRTQNDYPRLVNLDRPAVTSAKNVAEKHRFSQHHVDVLDLEKNALCEKDLDEVLPVMPLWYKKQMLEHDREAERYLRESGRYRDVWFVSCQKLLENDLFTGMMQNMLKTLQNVYENPVDIEYTVNLNEAGDFVVNLLQCRPLYVGQEGGNIKAPDLPSQNCFFDIRDSSMGRSVYRPLDVLIQVDSIGYYNYDYAKKYDVAAAIGEINHYYQKHAGIEGTGTCAGKNILLTVPGRIGTSSPELGVPVSFADMSGFCGICEVSESRAGYMPELSFGSHMFQDLVEADIFYGAIYGNEKTLCFNPEFAAHLPELFSRICPKREVLAGMIRVYDLTGQNIGLWVDAPHNRAVCGTCGLRHLQSGRCPAIMEVQDCNSHAIRATGWRKRNEGRIDDDDGRLSALPQSGPDAGQA